MQIKVRFLGLNVHAVAALARDSSAISVHFDYMYTAVDHQAR
jgi:hypothetical protein